VTEQKTFFSKGIEAMQEDYFGCGSAARDEEKGLKKS